VANAVHIDDGRNKNKKEKKKEKEKQSKRKRKKREFVTTHKSGVIYHTYNFRQPRAKRKKSQTEIRQSLGREKQRLVAATAPKNDGEKKEESG